MTEVKHDAVVVISWNRVKLAEAQKEADLCGLQISGMVDGPA